MYVPTIEKLDDIAAVLGAHPITLMIGSYALKDNRSVAKVLEDVIEEIERLEVAEGVSKLRKRYPKAKEAGELLKPSE